MKDLPKSQNCHLIAVKKRGDHYILCYNKDMDVNVTLQIPEHLLERAKRVAEEQDLDVSDIVAQLLANGLPAAETAVRSPEKAREIEAFRRLHPTLWKNYPGEYAAIYNEQLVDHDSDRVALLNRISQNYLNVFVLVRPILEEPEMIYHHRSIRWAK